MYENERVVRRNRRQKQKKRKMMKGFTLSDTKTYWAVIIESSVGSGIDKNRLEKFILIFYILYS